MSGVVSPALVLARRTLLNAIDALGAHRDTLILVGAQAVYVHTDDAGLRTSPFTTDADLAVVPTELAPSPLIDELMAAAGFAPRDGPGGWISSEGVLVDLLVPDSLAGKGSRGADLGPHGRRARRATGLEGVVVDRDRHVVHALGPNDPRAATLWVAGTAALLVAKVHKIEERIPHDRTEAKDALDVFRLLKAIPTAYLADRLAMLRASPVAAPATRRALRQLPAIFGAPDAPGVRLAVAASDGDDPDIVAASLVALVNDLIDACG